VRQNQNRPNLAIALALGQSGLCDDPNKALAIYEELCCMAIAPSQLVHQSRLLKNHAVLETVRRHGMYRRFPSNVPCKSAVSGLMLAIIPQWGAIVTYCPPLDRWGHSTGGQFLLTEFLKIIGVPPIYNAG
jgi:glutaminase